MGQEDGCKMDAIQMGASERAIGADVGRAETLGRGGAPDRKGRSERASMEVQNQKYNMLGYPFTGQHCTVYLPDIDRDWGSNVDCTPQQDGHGAGC